MAWGQDGARPWIRPGVRNGASRFPEMMAIGLLPANCFSTSTCSGYVPTITFGVQPYTFNPSDRDVSGDYDFIGVAEHELSEVMGRIPGLDQYGFYVPNDLFRYTAPGTRNLTAYTPGAYFSINSGTTDLVPFDTVAGAAHRLRMITPDSFDAFATRRDRSSDDGRNHQRRCARLPPDRDQSHIDAEFIDDHVRPPITLTADGHDSLGFAIGNVTGATTFTIAPTIGIVGKACTGSSCSARAGLYKVTST